MQTLTAGQSAPEFSLLNQSGEQVTLKSLLANHRVLLYFYPKAMTPGCTVQACGLRDIKAELLAKNVVAVGVSTDPVKSLAKFVERDQLNFMLLSDPEHQLAEAFGVWGEKKFMGKIYDGIHRISFLIEQNGVISQVFDTFKTSNHHEVVLKAL
ncbi:thioredoxin-dependent thiol peroxidase [Rheinheimera texasensis]|uniref:thioredoxin-dependent thiol peroxidase n=1 Tax=Rheinheimera texasensis TaxID=306205 RepID=UPI0004E0F4D1|nr:thioredoxin-dependent thiol peroxidase [Rheinheimera texasensis]